MSAKTIHSRNREIQSFTTTMASKHQQRFKHKQIFKSNKAVTHDIFKSNQSRCFGCYLTFDIHTFNELLVDYLHKRVRTCFST
jgi:hypothetical protein